MRGRFVIELTHEGQFDRTYFVGESANKVGCILPMVVGSILPHAEFGPNHHREDAPHFIRFRHESKC